jgi:DNA-binding PadR family transcriptional regulator
MYGYELRKHLAPTLQVERDISPGQIANTLARMEEANLLTFDIEPGDGPDRKVYRLTEQGLEELQSWYLTPEIRDYRLGDEFYIKLVLGLLGAPVPVEQILREQRRKLYQELHAANEMRMKAGSQQASPWMLLLENAISHLEADLRLIEMCEVRLDELKAYRPPPPPERRRGRPRKEPAEQAGPEE